MELWSRSNEYLKRLSQKWIVIIPTDVIQTDDSIIITSDISGLKRGEIQVTATKSSILIQGVRDCEERRTPQSRMNRAGRVCGELDEEISFMPKVDPSTIQATYVDGILRVDLKKASTTETPGEPTSVNL